MKKKYIEMDDLDKARLLHKLFPDEMPELLDFILGMAEAVLDYDNPGSFESSISREDWQDMAENTIVTIEDNKDILYIKNGRFADALFKPQQLQLTRYCLHTYCTVKKHPFPKIIDCIQFLFF